MNRHGVNKRILHKSSGDSPTLVKALVVSLLLHAAVIYLIPSVDLLPLSSSQYFEIETVTLEPEAQNALPEDEQLPDRQTVQQPEISELAQESVTPLSDYEPMTPEMINAGREPLYEQFLIPQQHFTLPETLESVHAVVASPQKTELQPESAALDLAILPAKTVTKTNPEAPIYETHQIQESAKDIIRTAEQPFERSAALNVSVAAQEALPDLERSQRSELIEQTSVPFLSTQPIMKQTTGSDRSVPVRQTLPNIQAPSERPSLRISQAKALPQHLPAEQAQPPTLPEFETVADTRAAALSTETEPEFRPAHSLLLPTGHSQEVLDVSVPVLKSVHPPAAAIENLVLPPDPQSAYVKSEEKLTDIKAFPAMTHDQIVQRAEDVERSVAPETVAREALSELPDNLSHQRVQPVMTQTIGAPERIYSPALWTKSPRKGEMPAEDIEQKVVDSRQSKSPVQAEHSLQKMLPSFQSFSSLPPLLMATQQSQQDQRVFADEEDILDFIARPQLSEVAPAEESGQTLVLPVPLTRQMLMPQNVLASAAIVPLIASEKTATTIGDAFSVKKIAEDAEQPGLKLARQPLTTEQQTREQEFETLQQPQKFISRIGSTQPFIPVQSPSFSPEQRPLVIGAKAASGILPSKPASFGMFVSKDRPVPDVGAPQKTIQMDDALQQIKTDAPEEGSASLVIEGPAAMRQVISKPLRLPEIALDVEVTIRLKFWVLPDGSVGEVVPLQRGDIRLERAAVQYLKSWRFTPLSSGNQTVWGIIPITYKLR